MEGRPCRNTKIKGVPKSALQQIFGYAARLNAPWFDPRGEVSGGSASRLLLSGEKESNTVFKVVLVQHLLGNEHHAES